MCTWTSPSPRRGRRPACHICPASPACRIWGACPRNSKRKALRDLKIGHYVDYRSVGALPHRSQTGRFPLPHTMTANFINSLDPVSKFNVFNKAERVLDVSLIKDGVGGVARLVVLQHSNARSIVCQ